MRRWKDSRLTIGISDEESTSSDTSSIELDPINKSDEEDPLNVSPLTMGELARVKEKYRKLRRSFYFLLIFSCCMILIILFFSYRAYNNYAYTTVESEESLNPVVNVTNQYSALASIILDDMNTSVDPCSDFYQYACGGWLARTTLRTDQIRYGRSFDKIKEDNDEILLSLLSNSSLPYLSSLFTTCMDTELAENNDAQLALINILNNTSTMGELYNASAFLRIEHGVDISLFFSLFTSIDDHNPMFYIPVLWQNSPLLPDSSYYNDTAILAKYKNWIYDVFGIIGKNITNNTIETIINIEKALLTISNTPAQNRDPENTYRMISFGQLPSLMQDSFVYVDNVLHNVSSVNVAQFEYFLRLYSTLDDFQFRDIKQYAILRLLVETLHFFGAEQQRVALEYQSMLYGIEQEENRQNFCIGIAKSFAGMHLSYYFVQQNFDDSSRNIVRDIINRLERSYVSSIQDIAWMDAETKATAIHKMNLIENMVGHPDSWPEWIAPPTGDNLFAFFTNASKQADQRDLERLHSTVDRTEWEMLPSAVNAYYEPSTNTIVFPAGILQPPFFQSSQPIAANYGGIGSVIGHELGHSLDDQGSQYTANGTLSDWWTTSSRNAFESAAQCIADLYSSYEVAPGVNIDGNLVLGESIADLGGLRQGYKALQAWKQDYSALAQSEEHEVEAAFGFTSDQLYFVSFAQNWCQKSTQGYELMLTETNPHPVSRFRVKGSLSNSEEFATVFNCPAGSAYNPTEKCQIW